MNFANLTYRAIRHTLVILCVLWWPLQSSSQTVTLPDTVFRNYLASAYSGLIDQNGNLVISAAAKVGGVLNGSNRNITSIEGVQYFTGVQTLSFVRTNLTYLPDLSSLKNLQNLNIMYNQLTSLPDLSRLKRLKTLNVHDNFLTRLPSLAANDSLIELNVNNNALDSMPDLSPLTQLQRLYVHHNNIKELRGVDKLTALTEFWCYSNLLSTVGDLSKLKNLLYFDGSKNFLISAPYFGPNSPMHTLYLHQNLISSLPDYGSYDSLQKVTLQQNKLTFTQLISLRSIPNYTTILSLSPQATLPNPIPTSLTEGNAYTFSTGTDQNVANVHYLWYKNGVLDTTVQGDKWNIPYAHLQDSGKYTCQLHHPDFPNFSLQTDTVPVHVSPCLDFGLLSTATTEINCIKTGTLGVSMPNYSFPLTYELKSPSSGKIYLSTSGQFTGLTESDYVLRVQTPTGCSKTFSKDIKIPQQKCKDYLITPDNDGNADTYYFEASGKAEIYDKRGNLVRRLNIPGEWDCSSERGKVANGYYIANINDGESQIGLSVVY